MEARRSSGWREIRALRQLVIGAVPVVVAGIALLVGLIVAQRQAAAPLRARTAVREGSVSSVDSAGSSTRARISWTPPGAAARTIVDRFPSGNAPSAGQRVRVHYDPADPGSVSVAGDTAYAHVSDLVGNALYVAVVVVVVLVVTAVRIARRRRATALLAAARRPVTLRVSRVRIRVGVIQRSWLVITTADDRRERWLPVFFDDRLSDLPGQAPARAVSLESNPLLLRLGEDPDAGVLWPAGRLRGRVPRGDATANPGTWGRSRPAGEEPPTAAITVPRQIARETPLLLAGPMLGVLWSYLEGYRAVGFGLSSALFVTVVFWLISQYGSDPSTPAH